MINNNMSDMVSDMTEERKMEEDMRRKLYGNNIQATCEHCLFGKRSSDGKAILCPHKGVMPLYHHCRKFSYDPIKRIPFRQPRLPKFSADDFTIESK